MELDIDELDKRYGGYITGPIDITTMPGYQPGMDTDEALARRIAAEEANPNATTIQQAMTKYNDIRPEIVEHNRELVQHGLALQQQLQRANYAERELAKSKRELFDTRGRQHESDLTSSSDEALRREMRKLRDDFERERLHKEINRSLITRAKMTNVLDMLDDLDLKRKSTLVNWAIGMIPDDIIGRQKQTLISNLDKFIVEKIRDKLDTIEIERRIRSYFADILYSKDYGIKPKPKPKPKAKPRKTKSKKKSVTAKRVSKKKVKK